jgi:hypothetical protein
MLERVFLQIEGLVVGRDTSVNLRGTDVRRRILALTDGITVRICRIGGK